MEKQNEGRGGEGGGGGGGGGGGEELHQRQMLMEYGGQNSGV